MPIGNSKSSFVRWMFQNSLQGPFKVYNRIEACNHISNRSSYWFAMIVLNMYNSIENPLNDCWLEESDNKIIFQYTLKSVIKEKFILLCRSERVPFTTPYTSNPRHVKPQTHQTPHTSNLRHIKPQTINIGLLTTQQINIPFHGSIEILFENLKINWIFTLF